MVRDAVEKLIRELSVANPAVERSPEAAVALSLAARMDKPQASDTSASLNAARVMEAIAALRAMAPVTAKETPLDEIRARRDRKLAATTRKPAAKARAVAAKRGKPS